MNIGIDIDEVVADQMEQLVQFYEHFTGIHVPYEKYHTQYWDEVWKVSKEETKQVDRAFKSSDFFKRVRPIEGAIESIHQLAKDNEIFFITSRPVVYREKTEAWLRKYLSIKFTLIHTAEFTDEHIQKTKAQICKELHVDLMIEDQDKYALQCAEAGIPVILFDKPWNGTASHLRIIRVKNWKEAMGKIESMFVVEGL